MTAGNKCGPWYQAAMHFKGWALPGPIAPGRDRGDQPAEGETLDALSGHFRIFQLKKGHRFSTDDLLAAAYGSIWAPTASRVLDLGSGIGTVAMVAAWRLPGASFVTIEAQEESVRLAKKSVVFNGLEKRFDVRQGDFRESVLAADERFDLVLGSPPYFPPGSGILGDHPQKIACRFEMRGSIRDYCEVASKHLAVGGWFACVFPVNPFEQEKRVEEAAREAGLTIVRSRHVALKEGEPPLLGVFAMMRSEDLPEIWRTRTWKEPVLTIRRKDGEVHPEYVALKLTLGFPP
jgi:tRNA1Val (adenine37-N6)-methyltransferase